MTADKGPANDGISGEELKRLMTVPMKRHDRDALLVPDHIQFHGGSELHNHYISDDWDHEQKQRMATHIDWYHNLTYRKRQDLAGE